MIDISRYSRHSGVVLPFLECNYRPSDGRPGPLRSEYWIGFERFPSRMERRTLSDENDGTGHREEEKWKMRGGVFGLKRRSRNLD